jgi:sugar phosphate isomerase/epimerase
MKKNYTMTNRRSFLKNSSALAAAGLLLKQKTLASFFGTAPMRPAGLQLFTLFNVIDNDVPGNIKKIAAIGYKEIESAFSRKGGFYGMTAKEFSKLLNDNGLSWKSHHVLGAPFKLPPGAKLPTGPDGKPITIPPMKNLRDNMQELVDSAAEAGVPYLVCANTPFDTAEELKKSVDTLNQTAEACKKANMILAYHNHDAEFKAVDNKIPYDTFLSDTDASTLKMELDLGWTGKAGVDPVELFKKNPGRFHLWHVKDFDKDFQNIQPVGNGVIDFKKIFENAETAGMKHFFVEHDMPADPFASITTSMNNLKKLLG